MLLFIDQPKQIRIVRTSVDDGVSSRSPIGRVMKSSLEISEELRSTLTKDELASVEGIVAIYRDAEVAKRQYFALQFAPIVRETMDYFEDGANDSERQLIMGSLVEALRRMRKFERNGQA